MAETSGMDIRVLGQLIMMQSVIGSLPDAAVIPFVLQGLGDVPGIESVGYAADPGKSGPILSVFPLETPSTRFGQLVFRLKDEAAFSPYADYLRNFAFMLAIILEGREQQRVIAAHRRHLEEEVAERTRELEMERELLAAIFDHIPVMLCVYDPRLKHFRVNRHLREVLGWTTEDANEGDFLAKVYPDPDYRATAASHMQSLTPGWREFDCTAKDGCQVASEWANVALSDSTLVGIGIDVRERRRAERQIRGLNADLERRVEERTAELAEANRELEIFTFAASHDLRGPLRRINSLAALLEQNYGERLDTEGIRFMEAIRQNAGRLAELVDDLLQHARASQQALELREVDALGLTRAVLQDKDEDIRAQGADVRLGLPALRVLADPQAFTQVMGNLVENALKYSAQAGRPVIEIGGEGVGERCRLWIRDNGIGFDMAHHDRIFEIFRRLHSYEKYTGSGVGLALVKRSMERMGGRVWAESEPGKGATFFLEFRNAG